MTVLNLIGQTTRFPALSMAGVRQLPVLLCSDWPDLNGLAVERVLAQPITIVVDTSHDQNQLRFRGCLQ